MTDPAPPAASAPRFAMLGDAGALTCTDEACLVPNARAESTEPDMG